MRLPLLFLLALFGSPTQTYFNCLKNEVVATFGDTTRLQYRVNQVRAESNFNPRATSDFKNWKKQGIDTVTAIRNNMGAAGLSQFIFATAERYGAETITTDAAMEKEYRADIYNPLWSLRSMCLYMKNIELFLIAQSTPKVRTRLMTDRRFLELCSTASYNTGERRVQKLLKKHDNWDDLKYRLPQETRLYAEKIVKGIN